MQADKPSSQLGLVVSLSRYRKLSFKCYRSRCSPVAHHPLNEDQSQGRVMCDSGFDMKASLPDYGFDISPAVFLLLFMARNDSQLPSLFNESKVISRIGAFHAFPPRARNGRHNRSR
jgi:hypothetical protein